MEIRWVFLREDEKMNVLGIQKILIVDDNEINRELLKDIFEGQYDILEAGDGEEAIELIQKHNEELVIIFLDMVMPKKSGLDVLEFMHESDFIKYIPVMMITGESTPEIEEKAYTLGVSDIVYKPFHARIECHTVVPESSASGEQAGSQNPCSPEKP